MLFAGAALLSTATTSALEADQFDGRSKQISDSTRVLNREVNTALRDIVAEWDKGHDELGLVNAIYHRLGGIRIVDKLERWVMKSPEVDRVVTPKRESIYAGMPVWATRAAFFERIGATIQVNDQLIGSDKIGHFISQGRKFYRRYRRMGSEEAAARQSARTERGIFGIGSTGTFSNADLVANYEGYRFYRSLFEDNVIPGKPAIVRWEDGSWVIQRQFDWADHVNAYWDEALNVNQFDDSLYKRMRERMLCYCPVYWENPALFEVKNEEQLIKKYAQLGLQDTRHLRLDHLCPAFAAQQQKTSIVVTNNPAEVRSAAQ